MSHTFPAARRAAFVLAACAGCVAPAAAAPIETRAAYSVTLLGLPLARADLVLVVEGGAYRARIDWRTVGLARLVASTHGEVTAEGRLAAGRPVPRRYGLTVAGGRKPAAVTLTLADGRVVTAEVEPPIRPRPEVVPLTEAHRRGVVDPLGAALVPTDGAGACARTLPIFDGWTRYDVTLTAKPGPATRPDGFAGATATCAVRWIPIAGHRTDLPNVRRMADNRDIELTLGRLDRVDLSIPVQASAATPFGTAVLTLDSLTTSPAAPATPARSRRGERRD
ncbi:DUF3108 domain-containing protein [Siculibacillus lacustris]|uniref:DUF3108 domain-containing protein n=1 Tax=Siculibacillus lacustris TaxID=1549641 RepID=UPI0013F15834|nr:DUF3108 domain-containing protein [Siculibacillus lacustris]